MTQKLSFHYLSNKTDITTKDRLLCSAIELFKANGYHNTTTRQISNSCDIKNASLFHYFRTKEEIAIESIKVLTKCIKYLSAPTVSFTDSIHIFTADSKATCLPLALMFEMPGIPEIRSATNDYLMGWHSALQNGKSTAEQTSLTSQYFGFLLIKQLCPDITPKCPL